MKTLKPFEGLVGGLIERQALTTSLHIAESFRKQHKNVLQTINNMNQEVKDRLNIQLIFYKDSMNRKQKVYRLNRDACTFLIMGMTGEKAEEFKLDYIDAFNKMEEFITSRLQGSFWHKLMMEAVDEYITRAGNTPTRYNYANEAKLINRCATGCSNRFGRDSFTPDETERVEILQKENMKMILLGIPLLERERELLKLLGSLDTK